MQKTEMTSKIIPVVVLVGCQGQQDVQRATERDRLERLSYT